MLYVHSMWSKPAMKNKTDNSYILKNFYIYLLSVLLIKKHGHKIELYCDKNTYEIFSLIPYDNIHVIDFDSDGISSVFWIWAKIKAQLLINEPYVHIDGDVFLFRDIIGNKLESGEYSVVVQSTENDKTIGDWFNNVYVDTVNPYLKLSNKHDIEWNKYNLFAYNCGVVGFSDMKLKNIYLNKVKELLVDISNDDEFKYDGNKYGGIFMITEQALLYYIINENNIKPLEILPLNKMIEYNYDWYDRLPKEIGYCHMLGISKYKENIKEKIRYKILKYFPQYANVVYTFEKTFK